MKKLKQKEICENIIMDFLSEEPEISASSEVLSKIKMLVDNELASVICARESLYSPVTKFKVACKFLDKYCKSLKKNRREPLKYEFGGKENNYARYDERILKLNKYNVENGTYYVVLEPDNYAILIVSNGSGKEDDDDYDAYTVTTTLYFVGKKNIKYKKKFTNLYNEYMGISDKTKWQYISYSNGTPDNNVIFKPFDQVIFKGKDKLIKYIDNWVSNIPQYYKYNMTPKLSILLYGQPGTGKSTVCKAVADYLGIDYVHSITPDYFTDDDGSLTSRRRKRHAYNAVISLDDIDCFCESREDAKGKENSTVLANLLSFLDNPSTFDFKAPDGVLYPVSIVIATTNYIDRLDDAVKRYGRFDLKLEMNEFDKEDAQQMCDIYNLKLEDIVPDCNKKDFRISPSYLQALCLENIDNAMKSVE